MTLKKTLKKMLKNNYKIFKNNLIYKYSYNE